MAHQAAPASPTHALVAPASSVTDSVKPAPSPISPGLKAVLQVEDRRNLLVDWDIEASNVMTVPRLESVDSIATRWTHSLSGAEQKMYVDAFYFIRKGVTWPPFAPLDAATLPSLHSLDASAIGFDVVTPFGVVLALRAPENDRDEDTTRDEYEEGMRSYGYNTDGRSPMLVMRVDESRRWVDSPYCALIYAAATGSEAWYSGKQKDPTNANLCVTEVTGFTNVIEILRCCPSDVPSAHTTAFLFLRVPLSYPSAKKLSEPHHLSCRD